MPPASSDSSPWSFSWRLIRGIAAVYLLVVILVYLFQRKLQYFPDPSAAPLPPANNYPGLREVELAASDGVRLRAWYWPGTRPATLVIFHGNAGHRGHRLNWLEDLHGLGVGVFILDYRGYGGSAGSPHEEGLYRDGEAAVEWVKSQEAGKLIYFGESLGCAVAVHLAVERPPAAMILQSGFLSAADVARRVYPFLPVRFLMKDRYDSRDKAAKVTCPVLVVHGDRDRIIPIAHGKALYEALPGHKEFYVVEGSDHNEVPWIGGSDYLQKIDALVKSVAQ